MIRDVVIVGAGPSGLATAIAAKQAGLEYALVEKGALVNSIFNFPTHMVFFTTPELLEIGRLPLVSPFDKPTRLEALRYYRRVVDAYDLAISFDETVVSIEREDDGVFVVETATPKGVRRARQARAVVLAIGYYDKPNLLGVPGEDLPHVSHYYTDAHPYYRKRVVIVGPSLKNRVSVSAEGQYGHFLQRYSNSYGANKAHALFNFAALERVFGSGIPPTPPTRRGHIADSCMQVLGFVLHGADEKDAARMF